MEFLGATCIENGKLIERNDRREKKKKKTQMEFQCKITEVFPTFIDIVETKPYIIELFQKSSRQKIFFTLSCFD